MNLNKNKKKAIIALSGGVDSAVAAYLLKKEYEVTAVFMQNWDDYLNNEDTPCNQMQEWKTALEVANKLSIPIHRTYFISEYWDKVFKKFISDIKKGLTPNPDILCNKFIKFNYFIDYITKTFSPDVISTGHYGKIIKNNKDFFLAIPKDKKKDQTYFLCQIKKTVLKKIIFPLDNLLKTEVRDIAKNIGLKNAEKKDSTGICFINTQKTKFIDFLLNYIPEKKGIVLDLESLKKIGKHKGSSFYTIGQRKGIIYDKNMKESFFVVKKDQKKNLLYVAKQKDEWLYSSWCLVRNFYWLIPQKKIELLLIKKETTVRLRHQHPLSKIKEIKININKKKDILITFEEKQRSVTAGQYAVIYSNSLCLGGGIIKDTEANIRIDDFLKSKIN